MRWIGMNGTNLTYGKIWQHGRSTDFNTRETCSSWDIKKLQNIDGIYSDRCPSKPIHDVSVYESTQ